MIRERIPVTGHRAVIDGLDPIDAGSYEAEDRFVASAVARGKIVARLRQDDPSSYATEAVVVDNRTEAIVVFFCRAGARLSPYRSPSAEVALAAARAVLATHGAFNW